MLVSRIPEKAIIPINCINLSWANTIYTCIYRYTYTHTHTPNKPQNWCHPLFPFSKPYTHLWAPEAHLRLSRPLWGTMSRPPHHTTLSLYIAFTSIEHYRLLRKFYWHVSRKEAHNNNDNYHTLNTYSGLACLLSTLQPLFHLIHLRKLLFYLIF